MVAWQTSSTGWFAAFEEYNLARAVVPHVKRTMDRLIRAEVKPMPDGDLGRIRVPVSLLWGRHDRMVPLRVAQIASARQGWPLSVVEDAAHVPHIEQPESFVDTLAGVAADPGHSVQGDRSVHG
jgi:pimeloyl-ACP methyl ester carboxylesterase